MKANVVSVPYGPVAGGTTVDAASGTGPGSLGVRFLWRMFRRSL